MTDKEQIMNNFAKDINVPTKEQIIIDIDRCKYRDKYTNFCLAEKDDIGETYTICTGTDCYFKRLARKTQECEELKEKYKWYDHYKDSALLNKKLCDKASDERARYRKALEEIEEFIEEEDWSILDYVFKRIKDIISKAKGEGE